MRESSRTSRTLTTSMAKSSSPILKVMYWVATKEFIERGIGMGSRRGREPERGPSSALNAWPLPPAKID
jgi:hypothetical protein